jgi:hypothetical protein
MLRARTSKGLLFVNKKKQKNFATWAMGCGGGGHGPVVQTFFGSFFQKRTCG